MSYFRVIPRVSLKTIFKRSYLFQSFGDLPIRLPPNCRLLRTASRRFEQVPPIQKISKQMRSDLKLNSTQPAVKSQLDVKYSNREAQAVVDSGMADGTKPSIYQRFKQLSKEYGKILVCVHFATSAIWFGTFFYAATCGIDVIPLLQYVGASEAVIRPFTLPGVGSTAVAYLLYKLASPLRYAVTIGGTRLAVTQLRRTGYLPPVSPNSTIRSLVRDGRSKISTRVGQVQRRK